MENLMPNEERFQFAVQHFQLTYAQVDKDLRYTWVLNPHKDFDPLTVLGKRDDELANNDGIKSLATLKQQVLTNGTDLRQEITFVVSTGQETYDILAKPIFDNAKNIIGVSTAALNITERKQKEQNLQDQLNESEILLKEIHHRVKNNLSEIEAFLYMQMKAQSNTGAQYALQDAISRIRGTRSLYETLLSGSEYQKISMQGYIENLVNSIQRAYSKDQKISITMRITDFHLPIKQAFSVGIIINELVTNAFKYAFKELQNGNVSIQLEKDQSRVSLTVQDNGIGIDENIILNRSFGLGYTMIEGLVKQFYGTFSISNDKGTKAIAQFKI